jgi:hypothetical protein
MPFEPSSETGPTSSGEHLGGPALRRRLDPLVERWPAAYSTEAAAETVAEIIN